VIFNCKDQDLAKKILDQSFEGNQFNAQKCIEIIQKLAKTGEVELADMYPMANLETAIATFDLDKKGALTQNNNKTVVKPGFYRTTPNRRRACKTGPISIDSGRNDGERRRVLQGAVVENHTAKTNTPDIFPVHNKSFNTLYHTHWSELPDVEFTPVWHESFGDTTLDSEEQETILKQYWQFLDTVNTAVKVGSRSKPPAQTFATVAA
jgi:hypothetical protein